MSNAREAIAAACQHISILKIENQNLEKQRDELLEALKKIVEAPRNTLSNGKALSEILKIAKSAIAKAAVVEAGGKV